MEFYLANGGQQRGPFPLNQLIAQGLRPDSMVWREGMAQWQRADAVPETQQLLQQANPTVAPAPPPPAPTPGVLPPAPASSQFVGYASPQNTPPFIPGQSQKVTAGVMGIIFGALGVHKFILGYNSAGTVMLLVSLLSCGFAAPIMHIIGIIEGITYLTKTDEQFHQIYVVGKKPWF